LVKKKIIMDNQEEQLEQRENNKNSENQKSNEICLESRERHNSSKLTQEISPESEDEQMDVFPTNIDNSGGSRITKTLNPRRVFRKRSSTESSVQYESPKLESRTRRFSKPLIDSILKNPAKQNRLSKINEKRHSRLSQHILKYIQLRVEIKDTKSFIVTIEKKKKIEDLIYQIEAEYAFQFIFPKNKEPSELKKNYSEPLLTMNHQFECNVVMNTDGEIFKYTDIVGEVFDMFDTVVCINIYEGIYYI